MDAASRQLHERLARHARGGIAAWDDWLVGRDLAPATALLHQTLIRFLKGCLSAYDAWRKVA